MRRIKVELEIPNPTSWELSALARLTHELVVAPGGLFDPYTPEKASWIEGLLSFGAIAHTLPGENGNHYYFITEFGKAMLAQANVAPPS